jgi:tRNA threonylcarbamoyladenosine biosynthesis protein TsaE
VTRLLACVSHSPEDTQAIAAALAPSLLPGDVVALTGDLGAGKTCFVQGAARALGVTVPVTSPSFVLVREYEGRLPVLHVDVYRLGNLQELLDLGYEEFLDPSWVVFIEWGDVVGPLLPDDYLEVELHRGETEDRRIRLSARGYAWSLRLAEVRDRLGAWSVDEDDA